MRLVAGFHDLLQKWLDCPKWCPVQAFRLLFHPGSQRRAFQKQQPASSDFRYSHACFSISDDQNGAMRFVEKIKVWDPLNICLYHPESQAGFKIVPCVGSKQVLSSLSVLFICFMSDRLCWQWWSSSEVAKSARAGQEQLTHRHRVKRRDNGQQWV